MSHKLFKIENLVEVPELKTFYSEQSNLDLKHSIEESGLKSPIVIDVNNVVIDGYRRVDVFKELGYQEIPVVVSDELATMDERITWNLTRIKTTQDKINEMRQTFIRYPKSQGKRSKDGIPYVRDEKISSALGDRWKGDVTVNKLEHILTNDLDGDVLSKGIVEKGWKIEPCYEYLTKWREIDETKNYGFTEKLKSGELKITEVNKFIADRDFLENQYEDSFKIPDKAESLKIDSVDIGKMERFFKKVALIFTSVPYYQLRMYDNGDCYQSGKEETKYEYCERIANIFKSLVPTLKDDANVIINIGETYDNGVGLGIPDLLKDYIEKTTGLVYKDRLIWSKPNPKPQNENIQRPINNVEYLLWFVVDPKSAKYNKLTYTDKFKSIKVTSGARDIDGNGKIWSGNLSLTKPYQKIYSHIKEQDVRDIINLKVSKNHDVYKICNEAHPAIMNSLLPVIPILMCTDEKDIVMDPFSGTNVVGRMSILLNRVAVAGELSHRYHTIGCKVIENSVEEFDKESLGLIHEVAYGTSSSEVETPKIDSTTDDIEREFNIAA